MSKKPISIRIEEDILKDVDNAALKEGRSRNSFIEWALRLYCNSNNKKW